jgi:hypothetical protein
MGWLLGFVVSFFLWSLASLKFLFRKDRKALCADLKTIYGSKTIEEAELSLQAFAGNGMENTPQSASSGIDTGRHHPIFRLFGGNQKGHLYDQCHRIFESVTPESSENKGLFPK